MTTTNSTPVRPDAVQPAITRSPSAAALFSIGGRQLLVAVRYLLLMTVVLGIGYPLVILGIGALPETDVRAATRLLTALAGQFRRHFALEEGHQA